MQQEVERSLGLQQLNGHEVQLQHLQQQQVNEIFLDSRELVLELMIDL